jgi:catechol 2,3-dioxygenase-like lactoylglutathione lyase family enzyme
MSTWLGLRHVALNVRDVAKSVTFYQNVLGMKLEWQPDPDNAYLTSGDDNLALHRMGSSLAGTPELGQKLDHFGFLVRYPENVDEWAAKIRLQGIPLEREPRTHRDGARSFYFRDPDENLIQIIYHPPISDRPGSNV